MESFNFLGLILQETLSWDSHVTLVKTKISKVIEILYRLKNIFPKETLKTLYTSLIASYLNYGLLLWGVESHKVEIMQKKAICLVTNSSYFAHTTPLFIKLNILKVQDMCKLKLLKLYYKLSCDLLPTYFNSLVSTGNTGRQPPLLPPQLAAIRVDTIINNYRLSTPP